MQCANIDKNQLAQQQTNIPVQYNFCQQIRLYNCRNTPIRRRKFQRKHRHWHKYPRYTDCTDRNGAHTVLGRRICSWKIRDFLFENLIRKIGEYSIAQRSVTHLNDPRVFTQTPRSPHVIRSTTHSSMSISQLTPTKPVLLQPHL